MFTTKLYEFRSKQYLVDSFYISITNLILMIFSMKGAHFAFKFDININYNIYNNNSYLSFRFKQKILLR